jgi:hypothetical protein
LRAAGAMHQPHYHLQQRGFCAFHARLSRLNQKTGRENGRRSSTHEFLAPDHRFPCSDDEILFNDAGVAVQRCVRSIDQSRFCFRRCMSIADGSSSRVHQSTVFLRCMLAVLLPTKVLFFDRTFRDRQCTARADRFNPAMRGRRSFFLPMPAALLVLHAPLLWLEYPINQG